MHIQSHPLRLLVRISLLRDDVDAVERAVDRVGGPTVLVGHSYGGEVITNAGYNNSNVTGLVYIVAVASERHAGT